MWNCNPLQREKQKVDHSRIATTCNPVTHNTSLDARCAFCVSVNTLQRNKRYAEQYLLADIRWRSMSRPDSTANSVTIALAYIDKSRWLISSFSLCPMHSGHKIVLAFKHRKHHASCFNFVLQGAFTGTSLLPLLHCRIYVSSLYCLRSAANVESCGVQSLQ